MPGRVYARHCWAISFNVEEHLLLINRQEKPSCILNYFYQLLFCLNLSAAALFWLTASSTPDGLLPVGRWKMKINGYFGLHPHNDLGAYITILIWATLTSVCILLFLRVFSENSFGDIATHWFAGLTTLVTMPLVWFVVFLRSPFFPVDLNVRLWVPVELCVAGLCAFWVLHSIWTIRGSLVLLVLFVHYGCWFWMFTQRFGTYSALLPLLGCAAGGLWVWFFVRLPRKPNQDGGFPQTA
jgi:hypothetical protein